MSEAISREVMEEERVYPPMHPGEFLKLEFLEPLELTPYKLAKELGVPGPRIYDLVRGKRGISADTALRLARYFGNSARFWLNLQNHYDLELEEERIGASVAEIRPLGESPAADPTQAL